MTPFLAMIMLWPCNFAPQGWAFCAGQILSIAQNTALFSLLGTTFGGDGVSTFALPNMQGRVPVGAGNGAGLSSYVLGQQSGAEHTTLLVTNMPSHTHPLTLTLNIQVSNAKGTVSTPASPNNVLAATYDVSNDNPIQGYNGVAPNTTLNVGTTPISGTAGNTGGSQPFSILQPYLALYYCIALQGVYPSRS
jgi:microcystin-dependent protein